MINGKEITLLKSVLDTGIGKDSSFLQRETVSTIQSNFKLQNWSIIKTIQTIKCKVPYLDRDNQLYKCKNRDELMKQQHWRKPLVRHSESQMKCK